MERNLFKLISIVIFIVLLICAVDILSLRDNFTLEYLRSTIEANFLIGAIIFIGMFALGNLIQLPGSIFMVAAILALGKIEGGFLTYIAAILSCIVTYCLIGYVGAGSLRGIENNFAKKLLHRLDSQPIQSIFILRAFFGTAPVLNYSLALSGVKFRYYVVGSMLGLIIPTFVHVISFEWLAKYLFDLTI